MRNPIWTAVVASVLLTSALATAPQDQGPNVVLVVVDDLGWMDLGCQGSDWYETPNLDRIAAEGARLTSFYASCTVCSPTRAALLTGRHPVRLRLTDYIPVGSGVQSQPENAPLKTAKIRTELPLAERTLAEYLGEAGYATAHVGKWHLGGEEFWPPAQGFEHNVAGCDWGQPPSYFDPYEREGVAKSGLAWKIPTLTSRTQGEYLPDRLTDEALAWIESARERPFFLHLAYYSVHTPIQPRADLAEHWQARAAEPGATPHGKPNYAAMVAAVDENVGRLMEGLERLGLRDETLVLVTSDNGGLVGPTSNTPLRAGKGTPYEGGLRVPFLVRWPGRVPAGQVLATPAISTDVLPTVLAAAGIAAPEDATLDGVDLVPLLTEGRAPERDHLSWHYPHYHRAGPNSVRLEGDWKLIHWHERGVDELYLLSKDPSEQNDLASAEPERARRMCLALREELDALGARWNAPVTRGTWRELWHTADEALPNVLLLGDSISMGYHRTVEDGLAGEANVYRPSENCSGTTRGLERIDAWLAEHEWSVIHFNWGLHDLKHVKVAGGNENSNDPNDPLQADPDRYRENLRLLVQKLQATGATLIMATTTPVPEGVRPAREPGSVPLYNRIAREVCESLSVERIDDLFSAAERGQIQRPKDVHFDREGNALLGRQVIDAVRAALD